MFVFFKKLFLFQYEICPRSPFSFFLFIIGYYYYFSFHDLDDGVGNSMVSSSLVAYQYGGEQPSVAFPSGVADMLLAFFSFIYLSNNFYY